MPKDGYTKMFEKMLNHKNIEVVLNTDYKKIINDIEFNKIIYTGPIDYFFDYAYGKLPYRSIKFEWENYKQEFFQDVAQVNYVDQFTEYTRVIEHKRLSNSNSKITIISREKSQKDGEEFYPIPTEENRKLYYMYKSEIHKLKNVIFSGRLAEYQYYNMDQVVANSLKIFYLL